MSGKRKSSSSSNTFLSSHFSAPTATTATAVTRWYRGRAILPPARPPLARRLLSNRHVRRVPVAAERSRSRERVEGVPRGPVITPSRTRSDRRRRRFRSNRVPLPVPRSREKRVRHHTPFCRRRTDVLSFGVFFLILYLCLRFFIPAAVSFHVVVVFEPIHGPYAARVRRQMIFDADTCGLLRPDTRVTVGLDYVDFVKGQ